jgi:hypothetical protein
MLWHEDWNQNNGGEGMSVARLRNGKEHMTSDSDACSNGGTHWPRRMPTSNTVDVDEMTDSSFRQRRRPTATNPQVSNSNINLVLGTRWGLTPRLIDRMTAGRKVILKWSELSWESAISILVVRRLPADKDVSRKVHCWDPLPSNGWWRRRRLTVYCSEKSSAWFRESRIITCSYGL